VLPVVSIAEMQAIDAEADEPVDVLVDRAGAAVARAALDLLGGGYGRRVVVVAGPGNNGADGRVAAERLRRRGVRTTVIDLAEAPAVLPEADLVIDAALGTGVTRPYDAPDPGAALVLAVDIPSGIDGDTGEAKGAPMRADLTVTFAALKAGLLLGDGPSHTGVLRIADIGLDVSRATIALVDDASAAVRWPRRRRDAHKWHQAVLVVAGSPGMTGAASMAAEAALRAGAGMVRLATPGAGHAPDVPREVVSVEVDETRWAQALLDDPGKVHAIAVGPGLGTSMATRHQVRTLVGGSPLPVVVDGDGLTALGADVASVLAGRGAPTVLTPHDGELERLTGHRPGPDRIAAVRDLAARSGAVVLGKGPTTVVAAPDGRVRLVRSGDQRLATAGTGDVLTGIVAALLAADLDPLDAAAVGAHVHGLAGRAAPRAGAVASDVVDALPDALAHLLGAGAPDHGA
jgi:NAD(P)H-hydrate epimerase